MGTGGTDEDFRKNNSLLEKKIVFYPLLTMASIGACYLGSFITDQKFYNQVNKKVITLIDHILKWN